VDHRLLDIEQRLSGEERPVVIRVVETGAQADTGQA
jgi:hypothetical protein